MAISANSYSEHEKIETRISDVIVGGQFTTATRPTLAQAEEIIDQVASEMNGVLLTYGYTAPIAVGDDPIVHAWAVAANAAGACLQIMNTFPSEAFDPDFPDPTTNRKNGFAAEYKRFIDAIKEQTLVASRSSNRVTGQLYVGSARSRSTGGRKEPAITRSVFDFPGTTSRVDDSE